VTREEVEALDPPEGCSWLGEWGIGSHWDTSMPIGADGIPIWCREALEHDGHEECCGHKRFIALEGLGEANSERPMDLTRNDHR
jgi:hypothetical protein